MDPALVAAGLLLAGIGVAHSVLGERFILRRLFRKDLPRLFGSDDFTRRTLRFAWHLTSLAWWGIAAIFLVLASTPADATGETVLRILSATFLASGALALVASKGRHLVWPLFLAVGVLAASATV